MTNTMFCFEWHLLWLLRRDSDVASHFRQTYQYQPGSRLGIYALVNLDDNKENCQCIYSLIRKRTRIAGVHKMQLLCSIVDYIIWRLSVLKIHNFFISKITRDRRMDRRTDGWTAGGMDRQTDVTSYRDAFSHLKRAFSGPGVYLPN